MYNRRRIDMMKERYPEGTRICLDRMENDTLMGIKGKFLVSYNDCPEIREIWDQTDIRIEEISRLNNLAQRYEGGCQYAELLISNYDTTQRVGTIDQLSFFNEKGDFIS